MFRRYFHKKLNNDSEIYDSENKIMLQSDSYVSEEETTDNLNVPESKIRKYFKYIGFVK